MARRNFTQQFRDEVVAFANASGVAAAKRKYNIGQPTIYRWRQLIGSVAPVPRTSGRPASTAAFCLTAAVPDGELRLKLTSGTSMLATLHITKTGVKFSPANAKKPPTRELTWAKFTSLAASGLLG